MTCSLIRVGEFYKDFESHLEDLACLKILDRALLVHGYKTKYSKYKTIRFFEIPIS